ERRGVRVAKSFWLPSLQPWLHSFAILVLPNLLVQPLVVGGAEHRPEGLAELPGMRFHFMRSECFLVVPYGEDGEMVCPGRELLEDVVLHIPFIASALFGQSLKQDLRFLSSWRRDIHVGHHVHRV